MGILGFNRWLLKNFPEIVRVQGPRVGQTYDHVAFDLNQILHQVARKSTSRVSMVQNIFRELDFILRDCRPLKSIFLAFDGPAPLAKLVTQRKRRKKSTVEYTKKPKQGRSRGPNASISIDRLELTPGCETLYYIRDAIEYWSHSHLQKNPNFANIDIHISGPDVPGEGELKLIDYCHASRMPPSESVVVVGGDADIILQALATVSVRNMFVYLRKADRSGRKPQNYVLSVWELARRFEQLFPGDSCGSRMDFIFLSILNGNDYLPKLRGVSFSVLWKRYMSLKSDTQSKNRTAPFKGRCIVDARWRSLNWPFLHALLQNLGNRVVNISEEVRKQRLQNASVSIEENSGTSSELDEDEEEVNNDDDDGDDDEVEDGDDEVEVDDDKLDTGDEEARVSYKGNMVGLSTESDNDFEMPYDPEEERVNNLVTLAGSSEKYYDIERWFRTLLWTIHMYVDGYCSDYMFRYGLPYGPSWTSVLKYIEDHNGDPFILQAPVSEAPALRPHAVAMALLPQRASHLLPVPLQNALSRTDVARRVYRADDSVDIAELLSVIESISETEYSGAERMRTVHGIPFVLSVSRAYLNTRRCHPAPRPLKPGPRFGNLINFPQVLRSTSPYSTAPPCYSWPAGTIPRMLILPYMIVNGYALVRSDQQVISKRPAPSLRSPTPQTPFAPSRVTSGPYKLSHSDRSNFQPPTTTTVSKSCPPVPFTSKSDSTTPAPTSHTPAPLSTNSNFMTSSLENSQGSSTSPPLHNTTLCPFPVATTTDNPTNDAEPIAPTPSITRPEKFNCPPSSNSRHKKFLNSKNSGNGISSESSSTFLPDLPRRGGIYRSRRGGARGRSTHRSRYDRNKPKPPS